MYLTEGEAAGGGHRAGDGDALSHRISSVHTPLSSVRTRSCSGAPLPPHKSLRRKIAGPPVAFHPSPPTQGHVRPPGRHRALPGHPPPRTAARGHASSPSASSTPTSSGSPSARPRPPTAARTPHVRRGLTAAPRSPAAIPALTVPSPPRTRLRAAAGRGSRPQPVLRGEGRSGRRAPLGPPRGGSPTPALLPPC